MKRTENKQKRKLCSAEQQSSGSEGKDGVSEVMHVNIWKKIMMEMIEMFPTSHHMCTVFNCSFNNNNALHTAGAAMK